MSLRRDQHGVATVLGAILVAALIATVFAHVQLHHVPVWEARAEAEHDEAVRSKLTGFHAAIIGTGGATGGASATLPLASKAGLGGAASAHSIQHESLSLPLRVSVDRLVKPNITLPVLRTTWSESWVSTTSPIDSIHDVHSFRLRLDNVDSSAGMAKVIARDASGDWVGNFTVRVQKEAPDMVAYLESRDGNESLLYGNPGLSMHLSGAVNSFWVDLLDPQYRYDGLLERAAKPISIRIEPSGLSTSHAISYTTTAPDGTELVLGGNSEPEELDLDLPTGRIVHHATNTRLVPYDLVIEHGALIRAQDDGAVFQIPPAADISAPGGMLQMALVIPVIEGQPNTIAGSHAATIGAIPVSGEEHIGRAARVSFNVSTAYPDLWHDFFQDLLSRPGLPVANHTLQSGPDWMSLRMEGPDPAADASDISLILSIPRYRLQLGA